MPRQSLRHAIHMFMVGEAGTSGAALVEFTIFVPFLVATSICTADFGLYYFQQMQVQNAAQAGAQYAIVNATAPPFSSINGITISSSTNYYCPSSLSTPVTLNSICSDNDNSIAGKYITVSSQATYNTLVRSGFFPNATYALAGSAMVRVQ
jgi:Flp pilus assembly protein TadG